MSGVGTVAVVVGVPPAGGGLGTQVANAVADWAAVADRLVVIGPDPGAGTGGVEWVGVSRPRVSGRFHPSRWLRGRGQLRADRAVGRAAADVVARLRPDLVYAFTQVGLESLEWARRAGVPGVLESPNGHIRAFRRVYLRESRAAGGWGYLGHPSPRMVDRVEAEYRAADRVRVSSAWAGRSLVAGGVPEDRVVVIGQRPTAVGFEPPPRRPDPTGPLRVAFVGSLDLRKGFVYLLRAARAVGPDQVAIRLVGGTVDRQTRRLLAAERAGLSVEAGPGDPRDALRWAELFVLPTLEDGSPFVLVEALAAGLPAVVTDACGNGHLVCPGVSGWVVPAGDAGVLAGAIRDALARRAELPGMGAAARAAWETAAAAHDPSRLRHLADDLRSRRGRPRCAS